MISPPGVLDRMIRGIRRLCSRRQTDDSDLKKRPEIFSGLSDLCIREYCILWKLELFCIRCRSFYHHVSRVFSF